MSTHAFKYHCGKNSNRGRQRTLIHGQPNSSPRPLAKLDDVGSLGAAGEIPLVLRAFHDEQPQVGESRANPTARVWLKATVNAPGRT